MHKLLVIGGGSIGERHVRCFQQTGRVEASLCEINPDVRQAVGSRCNLSEVYADLEEALADAHDVAVIAAPAHLHVDMAIQLAEAGVHTLIEKPLSVNLEGIDRLQAIVREKSLTTAVAYVYRAHPVLTAMREAVRLGKFGRPVELVAVSGQHFPFYRPAYRDIYYTSRATGGGAIQDALTHMINAGEWLVGPVARLTADAAHQVLEGVDVEDTVHVIARHDSVMASYSLNQHQAPNESTFTLICEAGTLRCEMHKHRWRWMTEPETPWRDEEFPKLERDEVFVRQANAFLDAVEGKRAPLCTLEEGIQTLRVNLAILKAGDGHSWQNLRVEGSKSRKVE